MKLAELGLTKEELIAKANKYLIDTAARFDFIEERAKGVYVYDTDGKEYLDFFAGIAVNNAGNCNEKVVAAIKEQLDDVMHTSMYPYTIPQALLAEKVCENIGMDKIFFQNSGAEANEAMIKMARKYGIEKYGPKKYEIITAKMSFHGRTMGSMAATGQPHNACQIGFGDMTPGFTYAEFNNLESFKSAVTENTIAIMVEPVQGEGGVYPGTEEFIVGLRKLCDEKGLLLLFDEVQTGFGRTGKLMGYMHYGVKPDIVSMAKALGGGMPIGAICAREDVAKAFTPGSHGCTFSGNPVVCAGAMAQIDEIVDNDLSGNAAKIGEYFMAKLATLPHIKEVRGKGLLVGAEFDESVSAADIKHECCERGLLVTACGKSIIRMVPPLIITESDCDKAYDILKSSVESLCK